MTDLQRLVDDPDVPEGLREDLRRAADHPLPFDVEAGLAKLEAAPKSGGPPGWVTPAVASLGALLGGLTLWWVATGPPTAAVDAEVDAPPLEAAQAPAASPAPAPAARAPDLSEAEPPEDPAPRSRAPAASAGADRAHVAPGEHAPPRRGRAEPSRERARPTTESGTPALQDEIAHMARLRAAAADDPRQALRLAAEGRRLFRDGIFSEEREAIAILALAELGRLDAARRRARRWLRRYPDSALGPRVRAAVR